MQSQAYVVFLLLWVHVSLIALNELGRTHGTDVGVHSASVEALLQKKSFTGYRRDANSYSNGSASGCMLLDSTSNTRALVSSRTAQYYPQ